MDNPEATATAIPSTVGHAVDVAGQVANHAVDTAGKVAVEAMPGIKNLATQLLDWLNAAADVAKEELPKIAREIIYWNVASDAVWCLISGVIVYTCVKISYSRGFVWIRWLDQPYWNYSSKPPVPPADRLETDVDPIADPTGVSAGFLFWISLLVGSVFSIVFMVYLMDLMKAVFAPRIYLIEYLSMLVKEIK